MKKKILFWVDGDITTFAIPNYLSEKMDVQAFAIIDITNKSKKFFQEQKFIKFEKIWFYHDFFNFNDYNIDHDYLQKFEDKYKINLWELAVNERTFHRFNRFYSFKEFEILKILETECKKFEEIISEIEPDFYVCLDPNFHYNELLYKLLIHNGIKTLIINQPNFKKTIISKTPRKLDNSDLKSVDSLDRTFEELQTELKKYNIFDHNIKTREYFKTSKTDLLKSAFYYIFNYDNSNLKTHYTYFGRTKLKVILDNIKNQFSRWKRENYINKNLKRDLDLTKNFIYFTLSVDEERNILLSAPFYTNQIEVIRSIGKSVPPGYTIYVKENPTQSIRYWRPIDEYREIQSIPNVTLIHPSFPHEKLNKNCSLSISISGSAGFEALFYGTSSIIFSDLGYNVLSSVTKIDSMIELPNCIRNALKKKNSPSELDKYLILLNNESINFDMSQIQMNYHKLFFYSGWMIDVEIPQEKMKFFLEQNKPLFVELIDKLHEKIVTL